MKIIIAVTSIILLASCGAGAGENEKSDTAAATEQAIINAGGTGIDSAQNMSGSNLIAANDCLTCHKINEKSVGPSYQQIADRYEMNQGNIQNLASRIITGGKGLWGNNAMTPHSTLQQSQAQEMVKYILSLRSSNSSK